MSSSSCVKLLGFSDICRLAMWAAAVPPIVSVLIVQWPGLLYWNVAQLDQYVAFLAQWCDCPVCHAHVVLAQHM